MRDLCLSLGCTSLSLPRSFFSLTWFPLRLKTDFTVTVSEHLAIVPYCVAQKNVNYPDWTACMPYFLEKIYSPRLT